MKTGFGMQLSLELAISAWLLISVGLGIWTYYDAWLRALSRAWSAAPAIAGPFGLGIYLLRSRLPGRHKQAAAIPEYDLRPVDAARPAAEPAVMESVTAAVNRHEEASAGAAADFRNASVTQGLPRCPRCGTAVSFYDVKCLRCGQLIRPTAASASV